MTLQPNSRAGRIRQAIENNPSATDDEIASIVGGTMHKWDVEIGDWVDVPLAASYVAAVRKKFGMRRRSVTEPEMFDWV